MPSNDTNDKRPARRASSPRVAPPKVEDGSRKPPGAARFGSGPKEAPDPIKAENPRKPPGHKPQPTQKSEQPDRTEG